MDPSFFFAIFRRLQAATGGIYTNFQEHFDTNGSMDLAGGLSLRSSVDSPLNNPFGIFGQLGPFADQFGYPVKPGWKPLTAGNNDPSQNPLYVVLSTSLQPEPVPMTVQVSLPGNITQEWPVMPPPFGGTVQNYTQWVGFNQPGPGRLIDALSAWVTAGKQNDTPANGPITFDALNISPPPAFPLKPQQYNAILFVPSFAGDDGRRHGDGDSVDPGPNYLPANFWDTSQIFLTNDLGQVISPPTLDSGTECYVVAMIGNSGLGGAGRLWQGQPQVHVICNAYSFNTFLSPSVPLPSLHNIVAGDTSPVFEHYNMRPHTYDTVGFRFNVDAVATALETALANGVMNNTIDLGGATPKAWLNGGHACVKVLLTAGEVGNPYPPMGNKPLDDTSNPNKDRHIAQKNLVPLNITTMGAKQIKWTNFIVAQADAAPNELLPQHHLSPDVFAVYIAIPRRSFTTHVDPRTSKGGAYRGFTVVTDGIAKPFPEAVILRQTEPEAMIRVAEQARGHFIGMALGIEWQPERVLAAHVSDIAIAHTGQGGERIGGLTLRPYVQRGPRQRRG